MQLLLVVGRLVADGAGSLLSPSPSVVVWVQTELGWYYTVGMLLLLREVPLLLAEIRMEAAAGNRPEVVVLAHVGATVVVTEEAAPWPLVLVVLVPRRRRHVVVGENDGDHPCCYYHCWYYCWYNFAFVARAVVVVVPPHVDQYTPYQQQQHHHRHNDDGDEDDEAGNTCGDIFPTAVGVALARLRTRHPTSRVLPFRVIVVADSQPRSGSVVVDFVVVDFVLAIAALAAAAAVVLAAVFVVVAIAAAPVVALLLLFHFSRILPPPPWHDTIA